MTQQVSFVISNIVNCFEKHNINYAFLDYQDKIEIVILSQLIDKAIWALESEGAYKTLSTTTYDVVNYDDITIYLLKKSVELNSPFAAKYLAKQEPIDKWHTDIPEIGTVYCFNPEFEMAINICKFVRAVIDGNVKRSTLMGLISKLNNNSHRLTDTVNCMAFRDYLKKLGMADAYCVLSKIASKYYNVSLPAVGTECDLEEYDTTAENLANRIIDSIGKPKEQFFKLCYHYYMVSPSEITWMVLMRMYQYAKVYYGIFYKKAKKFLGKSGKNAIKGISTISKKLGQKQNNLPNN